MPDRRGVDRSDGKFSSKYLWTSLFRLSKDIPLRVYPGSRDVVEKGQKKVDRILSENINCEAIFALEISRRS